MGMTNIHQQIEIIRNNIQYNFTIYAHKIANKSKIAVERGVQSNFHNFGGSMMFVPSQEKGAFNLV